MLLAVLALALSACDPPQPAPRPARPAPALEAPAGEPDPAPGYRLVPPLPADAQARADSILRTIEQLPIEQIPVGDWIKGTYRGSNGIFMRYRYMAPETTVPGRRYPLVVLFHGSGEIGTDNTAQLTRFAKAWARPEIRRAYPAWILVPQMPERSANYTAGPESAERASVPAPAMFAALEIIDHMRRGAGVDSTRVYAVGFSMGASTVFQAVAHRPEMFAAAIPIAGVPDPAQAAAVARTPLWIIHGNSDEENPIGPDRAFYPLLSAVPGARVTFWEYDGGEHRVPADLLTSDAFARWLWAHHKPPAARP